jgi:hypothetical protein
MTTKRSYVSRGNITCDGATKQEAKANLERMIDRACSLHGPYIEARFGKVFVMSESPTGWEAITTFTPDHGARATPSMFCMGQSFEALRQSLRVHLAQNAWTSDVDMDEHIAAADLDTEHAGELRRWIEFQFAYREAKGLGLNDAEAHEWACRA